MSTPSSDQPILEARALTKRFGALVAVDAVDLTIAPGSVTAVVGENGAGKSTLMKLLTGVHRPDAGDLVVDGQSVRFKHPLEARRAGISIIHQELSILPERSVAQNVFLGVEPRARGVVDRRAMHRATQALLDRLGVADAVRPDDRAGDLTLARQQMVEIAKALAVDARVLIMDEPTAALAPQEAAALFTLIGDLATAGTAVVYISHRLEEVFHLADRVVVLRDGQRVAERDVGELTEQDVVRLMVGRDLDEYYPDWAGPEDIGEVVLRLDAVRNERVGPISLSLRRGEVLGIGGLEGAGQAELADGIFGLVPFTHGSVDVAGTRLDVQSPRQAVAGGIGYVTADRKGEGLVVTLSIRTNAGMTAAALRRTEGLRDRIIALLDRFALKYRSAEQPVAELSGGNQQKVVLTKWLTADVDVLLLHEPTRGIDVGSKAEIHTVLRDLATQGMGVVMISSEIPELLGVSDRVVVLRRGTVAGELPADASEEDVMSLATGITLDQLSGAA
ncbi:sugar ABC transporter ATP-binding protein [Euzebya tangerina]|uniref:sugar ABC transporter ATP-binding protein n=1 Tax=Euzebya tangerina TaxID=591198 RepID=UPI000E3243B9|nr:sugar ABC transporter ATP-binding protein [Euzebya tangerina]